MLARAASWRFVFSRLSPLLLGIIMSSQAAAGTLVDIQTNRGLIRVELADDKAPATVDNFLRYVDQGYYDGTIFHRIIAGFMIQGGGYTEDFGRKDTAEPIQNEADNGLKNARGSIAMARTGDPHSATAQFFINHADNGNLDHRGKTPHGWGYAVFGAVVEGMDVVDAIATLPTGPAGPFRSDVPKSPVVIESIRRISPDAPAEAAS